MAVSVVAAQLAEIIGSPAPARSTRDETTSLPVTQVRLAGLRQAECVSEDGVHAVYTNASLEQEGAGVAIGLDNQGQGTQGLRNGRGVVALARLLVDEHRSRGRKSPLVRDGPETTISSGRNTLQESRWIARH